MIYTINISNYTSNYRAIAVPKFKFTALHRLQAFPINTAEKLLDRHLREQHKITLNHACYLIVLHCTIEEQKDDLVVTITDKNLDKLARLITYGTGRISGSRILSFAFQKL
jgi:hypothetical protein